MLTNDEFAAIKQAGRRPLLYEREYFIEMHRLLHDGGLEMPTPEMVEAWQAIRTKLKDDDRVSLEDLNVEGSKFEIPKGVKLQSWHLRSGEFYETAYGMNMHGWYLMPLEDDSEYISGIIITIKGPPKTVLKRIAAFSANLDKFIAVMTS